MLPALHLDFRRGDRLSARAGWLVLGAGALAFAGCASHVWRLQAQVAVAESSLERLEREAAAARAPQPPRWSRADAAEVGRANALLRTLNVPWEELFGAIEAAGQPEVALLRLEPDLQKGTVRITAEAKDFPALVAYAAELSTREPIKGVVLQGHEPAARGRSLRFTLVARWRGTEP